MAKDVKLGQDAKDIITGFSGIVVSKCQHLTGCDQALLKPRTLDKDGKVQAGEWFDVQRLEVLPGVALVLDNENRPGADEPPPAERSGESRSR